MGKSKKNQYLIIVFVLATGVLCLASCASSGVPAGEDAVDAAGEEQIQNEGDEPAQDSAIDTAEDEEQQSGCGSPGGVQPPEEPAAQPDPGGQDNGNGGEMMLIGSLSEISRNEYIARYGEKDLLDHPVTAAATRIGKVELNKNLTSPGAIKAGDSLVLSVFGGQRYEVTVEAVTGGEPFTVRGHVRDQQGSLFMMTLQGELVLASLELPQKDLVYLIRYSPRLPGHYLFQAALSEQEILEGGPPLMPPEDEN